MQSSLGVVIRNVLWHKICPQSARTLSSAFAPLISQNYKCGQKSHNRYLHKLNLGRNIGVLYGCQTGKHFAWSLRFCIDSPTHGKVWVRQLSMNENDAERETKRTRSVLIYMTAIYIFMVGMSYAGVPLYRIFCQATGLGGQAVAGDSTKVKSMAPIEERLIRVRFNADVASSMKWNFRPLQNEVQVFPGETALAFYAAKNPTDKPIVGISTYNIVPFEAGQYFNKIQCFCFEDQRLNPKEEVDMPVFFYIDPEFVDDPKMEKVETITLSYTFFEAKDGMNLPLPGYAAQ